MKTMGWFASRALLSIFVLSGVGSVSPSYGADKVVICHATSSASNPFVINEVAASAVPAHIRHGDVYPTAGVCPGGLEGGPTAATPEPITMLLFGAGLAGVGYVARRRKQGRD